MRAVLILLILSFGTGALAEVPFQFAARKVRAPNDPNVSGVRIAMIHGQNQSVRGIDLGFFSWSETHDLTGFSSVIGVGRLTGDLRGVASSVVNLHSGEDRGLNMALLNRIRSMRAGANLGFINLVDEDSTTDLGWLNVAKKSRVQIGFLNITDRIDGVQIGFLNLAENGFLPVFPFFNFPKK